MSVLGLGAMGTALAEALLAAGHPTTVWNRTPAKAKALVAKGAVAAGTAAEAVEASRLVIVCLLVHQSVVDVLDPVTLSGRVVVNLTNGTPAQARELAEWVAKRDADLLDGGIMAIPPMIAKPGAFILYSGSRSAFDTHRPVLDALAESHYMGADPGMAALYDISLLSGMYGMFMGVAHAFALIASEGRSATEFAPMLTRWLIAMTGMVGPTGEAVDNGGGEVSSSSVEMQAAAYSNLIETAMGQGVSPELLSPLQAVLDQQVADGYGAEGISGIVRILRKAAK